MVSRLDVAALLDSLAPVYPGGVPRSESTESPGVGVYGPRGPGLVVLGTAAPIGGSNPLLAGPAGQLLEAALTKGLKLPLGEVTFVVAAPGTSAAVLAATLDTLGSRVGLALGEVAGRLLGATASPNGWWVRGGCRWRVTVEPSAVVADAGLKRLLWNDLQFAGAALVEVRGGGGT